MERKHDQTKVYVTKLILMAYNHTCFSPFERPNISEGWGDNRKW